ncbi:MAG: hypothetical protein A3D92_23015 [Bacteroidetes bacterium RIFCSPHIGHO2_02_FULL_44_7]|nr:MAG: hypothetical protein A3D92_23015 [Bacteroidetes bacterium RIFCSPHIGHO2_02_FULL_44_7]
MEFLHKEDEYKKSLLNAQFVQQGLLPKKRHLKRVFTSSFVMYRPKDFISGDFYWLGRKNQYRYLVVGDCTGHGISAALSAVLALNLFEYTIMNKGLAHTDQILSEIDKRYTESFTGTHSDSFDNPWIDLSLVRIDDETGSIQFSSANRKMLHVRSGSFANIYKGTGYPIGGWQIQDKRIFQTVEIDFMHGDRIYLGSDGFQDQFGGPSDKKYGSDNLHDLLIANSSLPFDEQLERLTDELEMWKGKLEQTDDICIVGIEL